MVWHIICEEDCFPKKAQARKKTDVVHDVVYIVIPVTNRIILFKGIIVNETVEKDLAGIEKKLPEKMCTVGLLAYKKNLYN